MAFSQIYITMLKGIECPKLTELGKTELWLFHDSSLCYNLRQISFGKIFKNNKSEAFENSLNVPYVGIYKYFSQ